MNVETAAKLNRLCIQMTRRVMIARASAELRQERQIGDFCPDQDRDRLFTESRNDTDSSDRKD